jgi:hypothetical protein
VKHEFKVLTVEEVMNGRSSAYEFIDFDKIINENKHMELNPHIESFLLKNGFDKYEDNVYNNPKCTITVLEDCYQIEFDHPQYGSVSTYTDSHSIMHLVGVLTWNDLMDKNYNK